MTDPCEITAAFDVGRPTSAQPVGAFLLRRRPDEFAVQEYAAFDHAAVTRMADAGLPVPRPLGHVSVNGGVFEMYTWLDAPPASDASPGAVGRFLADMHRVFAGGAPAGKEGMLREDHPDLIEPYVNQLRALPGAPQADLDAVVEQLNLVRSYLGDEHWRSLPQTVIHGDLHPGNLHVVGDVVVGLFDFDYLSVQARVRDLGDAMIFFADRPRLYHTDNIHSLVQPFTLNGDHCRALIDAYDPLTDDERAALPWVLRSRCLQMKLRAIRKVADNRKLDIVFDGLFETLKQPLLSKPFSDPG